MWGRMTYKSIDVVWVDGCAAFLGRELDTRLHDAFDVLALDIDPVLAFPAVQTLAVVVRSKLVCIVAPVFAGAGAEVADDLVALALQGADG